MLWPAAKLCAYAAIFLAADRLSPRPVGALTAVMFAVQRFTLGLFVGIPLYLLCVGIDAAPVYALLCGIRVVLWSFFLWAGHHLPGDVAVATAGGATLMNAAIDWMWLGPMWEGGPISFGMC